MYDYLKVKADHDEIYAINNKDISPPENYDDIVVKGDNKSNSLIFKINRVIDGVDLFGKTFHIFYINADGFSDIVSIKEIIEYGDYLIFSWLLDSNVTHSAGKVKFIITVSDNDYIWKSKAAEFDVVDTLNDNTECAEYNSELKEKLKTYEEMIKKDTGGFGVASEYEYTGVIETIVEGEIEDENSQ